MSSASSKSCGSGKLYAKLSKEAPTIRPAYINGVIKRVRKIDGSCTEEQLLARASELTNHNELWSIYFSGIVLDPARDRIGKALDTGEGSGKLPAAKVPVKLQLKPISFAGTFGQRESLTSFLLENYGSLHASVLLDNEVVLEWNTAGLVIPTGKAIIIPAQLPQTTAAAGGSINNEASQSAEEEISYEFEAVAAKKEFFDKIIKVIVRYNRHYSYHPIFRNCQKFVADLMQELAYPKHAKLEGRLGDYYTELKKLYHSKPAGFGSHAELNRYVKGYLKSDKVTPLKTEWLLSQYFLFHMTSMTESERPERWVCQEVDIEEGEGPEGQDCLMLQLERRLDLKTTVAYRVLSGRGS